MTGMFIILLFGRTLAGKLEEEQIKNRAASLPILVCHGKGNNTLENFENVSSRYK